MTELMQCSRQWATRSDDERFISLQEMHNAQVLVRQESREIVTNWNGLKIVAENDDLLLTGNAGIGYSPTYHALSTLCGKISAPANYIRNLPVPLAAECLNHSMQLVSENEVGLRLRSNGEGRIVNSLNGPKYGRIWGDEITGLLLSRGIDGVNGDWVVPGEFGKEVTVTKDNTTLYASDHDMFIFLADEKKRIELPNRRNGKTGTMARGFFIANSEVGARRFSITTFLFDDVCRNRIVWGAEQVMEVSIRHGKNAPNLWIDRVMPALQAYHNASTAGIEEGLKVAQLTKLDEPKVIDMLGNVVGKRTVPLVVKAFKDDENRPMETLWDVVTGLTAYGRSVPFTDDRIAIETAAGDMLAKVYTRPMALALPDASKTQVGYSSPIIDF
jgi:hypothetical protein